MDPDHILKTATPVVIPQRCVSCHEKVGGKHVMVMVICEDCFKSPEGLLSKLILEEWNKKKW